MHAYVSFVRKLIIEGPLKRPKLKICLILMKFSRWGFSKVLISPMAFIFGYSPRLLVYNGFLGVILRWCIAPRSEVPMFGNSRFRCLLSSLYDYPLVSEVGLCIIYGVFKRLQKNALFLNRSWIFGIFLQCFFQLVETCIPASFGLLGPQPSLMDANWSSITCTRLVQCLTQICSHLCQLKNVLKFWEDWMFSIFRRC